MRSLVFAAALVTFTGAQSPSSSQTQAPPPPSCPELARTLTDIMRNDARLRDWPNLARYREANRTLTASPQVVFIGDSITDAWQQEQFNFFQGKPYADRGISGQTTPQMLVRFRPDVINLKPRAVVILAGTNDIAENTGPMTNEEIQGNLASMSELAKANGIRVILASITPVSAYHVKSGERPQTDRRPMSRIRAINDWIKRYAAENGHIHLDYFSAMVDDKGLLRAELSADDLHPNAEGYRIMGPLAEAAIQQTLR
jgi:lysophospholipase L1-like esterase